MARCINRGRGVGLVLAINFVLANRIGFSPVAPDSFDEGISLDALLVAVQIVLLGVALALLARLQSQRLPETDTRAHRTQDDQSTKDDPRLGSVPE